MLNITVNEKHNYTVELNNQSGKLNQEEFTWDVLQINEGKFHIIKENKSYTADVVKVDYAEKQLTLRINNTIYTVTVKDRFDMLLKSLGMDAAASAKVSEIKAPMPGLVIEVKIEEGQAVKKGDALLVLEAMKMENILKSPADGIVKKIQAKKGTAVEKNQLLISFQ